MNIKDGYHRLTLTFLLNLVIVVNELLTHCTLSMLACFSKACKLFIRF